MYLWTTKFNFADFKNDIERVKKNVGKEANAGNQNRLLFPYCFTELPLRTLHLEIMYRANYLQHNPGVLRFGKHRGKRRKCW